MKTSKPALLSALWKAVFAAAACAFAPSVALAAPTQSAIRDSAPVRLNRPSTVGSVQRVSIHASKEEHAVLEIPGAPPGKAMEERYSVDLHGTLEVLAVNRVGNASRLKIQAERVEAMKNDAAIPLSCAGKTLYANLADSAVNFMRTDGLALYPYEVSLLHMMFRPAAADTMNDIAGPDRILTPGLRWTPPADIVRKAIRLNNIHISDSEIIADAKATPCTIDSLPCWLVALEFKTIAARKDLGFEFKLSMILPENPELSALRMRRESTFVTLQPVGDPVGGQALPPGTKVRQASRELMIADMAPIKP